MQVPNKKAASFSFHRCVFYLSSVSLISQWIRGTRTFISSHVVMVVIVLRVIVLGVLAGNAETGDEIIFAANNERTYKMLRFESFVFTCLTYRNVQRFRNGPVHEFYGLKASQRAKFVLVLTNTHRLKNQESSGTEF